MDEATRNFFERHLFTIAGTPVTVATLLSALTIVIAALVVSWFLQRVLVRPFRRATVQDGTIAAIRRLIHYAVVLVGMGIALDTLGINLGALFAAGAFFAVALGFAMQNIAQNFVSGVILLVERTIKPGDVLEVEGRVVRVVELRIRSTLVRTRDDEDLIVPNSVLVQSTVKNFTLRDSLFRLNTTVGVVYSSDLEAVFRELRSVAAALPWRYKAKDPRVFLTDFGDSSVNFRVSVWIEDPWDARVLLSNLNDAIWWALKNAGIVIAFPQLDVHLDPPVMQSIERLSAGSPAA